MLFGHPVMSDFLWPHGLQHARPPCPSPSPKACPSSCPLHQWCHPANLILWHPLLILPSIFPSIRDFSNESTICIRWPKYWSFSFSISPSNEHSGLISLKIDCFDFLAVQGTLRILLQHHSLNASILWHSAFFRVQLWQLYVTTGKAIALMLYNILFYTIYYTITSNKAQVIDLKMKTNKCKVCVMIVA